MSRRGAAWTEPRPPGDRGSLADRYPATLSELVGESLRERGWRRLSSGRWQLIRDRQGRLLEEPSRPLPLGRAVELAIGVEERPDATRFADVDAVATSSPGER